MKFIHNADSNQSGTARPVIVNSDYPRVYFKMVSEYDEPIEFQIENKAGDIIYAAMNLSSYGDLDFSADLNMPFAASTANTDVEDSREYAYQYDRRANHITRTTVAQSPNGYVSASATVGFTLLVIVFYGEELPPGGGDT